MQTVSEEAKALDEKERLRKIFSRKREALNPEVHAEKSERIAKLLMQQPLYLAADVILLYAAKRNEVLTRELIQGTIKRGKRVALPYTNVVKERLEIFEIRDFDRELEPGPFNILSPKKEFKRSINPGQIDLVVSPGIAFDRKGGRVGWGVGYYDRTLKQLKAKKIGLAFDFQVVDRVPVLPHDVRMDKIITETKVIDCRLNLHGGDKNSSEK